MERKEETAAKEIERRLMDIRAENKALRKLVRALRMDKDSSWKCILHNPENEKRNDKQ